MYGKKFELSASKPYMNINGTLNLCLDISLQREQLEKNKTTSLRRQTLKFELLKYFTQNVYTPNDQLILLSGISVQLVLSRILVSLLKASYSYSHTSADCIWLKPPLSVYHFFPPLFFMFYLFIVSIYLYIHFSWVSSLLWGCVRATRSLHDEVPGIWFTSCLYSS